MIFKVEKLFIDLVKNNKYGPVEKHKAGVDFCA